MTKSIIVAVAMLAVWSAHAGAQDWPIRPVTMVVPFAAGGPVDTIARIFGQFVEETEILATTPRWYNTLTTNCTNSLVAYVNRVREDAIPWNYSLVLTGRADTYLASLGYVDLASPQPITRDWLAANPLR